jgi:hypothetical protein
MSTLQTKSFSSLVGIIAAGMQGRINNRFLNFAIGSMLRGLAESVAGVLLNEQKQALDIAMQTRLATSFGPDVDSWLSDFGLTARLGASAATGLCTFSRYTAAPVAVYVPVGAVVRTQDGTLSFTVYADTTNASFIPSYGQGGGYLLPASVSSVSVPVGCTTLGTVGNVAASMITLTASNIPGVDTVTNPAAFTNAVDQEGDAQAKDRFVLNILGKSGGTAYAIRKAIANVKVGMQTDIIEFQDYDGTLDYGMTTVIVDDGSGALSNDLLTSCQLAVNDERAMGCRIGVYAGTAQLVDVTMQIATEAGYDHNFAVAQVVAALSLYLDDLSLGQGLSYFALIPVALSVPGVTQVLAYTLNGGTSDISGSAYTTVKAGSFRIS